MWDDKVTSKTPIILTIVVILLLVLRFGIWFTENSKIPEKLGVGWQEPSNLDLTVGRTYQSRLLLYYFCEENSEACQKANLGALLNKEVVQSINDNFLPIKVLDRTDASQIDSLAKELRQKLEIVICPSFAVTLPNGKLVGKLPGYFGINAKNLLSLLRYSEQKSKYLYGLEYLTAAQYDRSAQAFRAWLQGRNKSDPEAIEAILYCALAYKMNFEENKIKEILAKISNNYHAKDADWPTPFVQFLLGKLDAQTLMQKCYRQESREPQAYYFIGMVALRNGDIQGAVSSFKQGEKEAILYPEIHSLLVAELSKIFNAKN